MDFLEALREQVEQRKSRRGRWLLKKIDALPPKRRAKVVARLEEHARVHLSGMGVKVGADWGKVGAVDWAKFFDSLLKFLAMILPLILPFIISVPWWLVPLLLSLSGL